MSDKAREIAEKIHELEIEIEHLKSQYAQAASPLKLGDIILGEKYRRWQVVAIEWHYDCPLCLGDNPRKYLTFKLQIVRKDGSLGSRTEEVSHFSYHRWYIKEVGAEAWAPRTLGEFIDQQVVGVVA